MPHAHSAGRRKPPTQRRLLLRCSQLIFLQLLLSHYSLQHAIKNEHSSANATSNNSTRPRATDAASSESYFVPHRFSSSNNITILHEVHEIATHADRPLVLNTHEVLPVKPLKKKPYTLLDKTIFPEYEKARTLKEYELHPVTFDFNLSDLEDLEHETVKKGDLSAEEKHLLRNAEEPVLSYNERVPYVGLGSEVGLEGFGGATDVTVHIYTTENSLLATNATLASTTTQAPIITTPNVVATISPHIFKVHKNKTLKKGRELLKQEEETPKAAGNNVNSISHYFGVDTIVGEVNATAASLHSANFFQIITNLYDHFYWQASEIRTKVSTACGLEMQAYLTGLHGNFDWAQKAFYLPALQVASNFPQLNSVFMNCVLVIITRECANQQQKYRREKEPNDDYEGDTHNPRRSQTSQTLKRTPVNDCVVGQRRHVNLQVGECLPRSCNAHDVHAILTLDPHAQMLVALNTAAINQAQYNQSIGHGHSNSSSGNHTIIQVLHVRAVPGAFSYWRELKFQIFLSFVFSLLLLVITATWYQAKLNQLQLTSPHIAAISAKIDAVMAAAIAGASGGRGGSGGDGIATIDASVAGTYTNNAGGGNSGAFKSTRAVPAFELYQMSTLTTENNNVLDIEADVSGNKTANSASSSSSANGSGGQANGNSNGAAGTAAATVGTTKGGGVAGGGGGGSIASNSSSVRRIHGELSATDVEKSHMADYRLETSSSMGASSTYETRKQLGLHEKFLLCFAFQTNAGSILNMTENKEQQTSCVHGLRVFSVLWTIMVHTYLQMFTIGENRFQRNIVERSFWYQFVGNATFSVDTFFFISGFLVTLLFLKQDKKYPDDTGQYFRRSMKDTGFLLIYRYIRLTPAYLFVILFNDFALRQTFDNSVFQPNVAADTCSRFWWRNILYINNFYPLSEICMIWSWYMANDMQFFVMSSLLLVLSIKYFKTAAIILCSFLLSSWGVSGIISLHYRYTHKVANPFESFDFLYDKPWQRVGTYIMELQHLNTKAKRQTNSIFNYF
ncbi:PREDICTED: uncharacterized protein LOC108362001 [Rhagoletis zephyria]|uniref:uncharacterized protein LOC108362001 n=1 Tax=Rhagoletis zephyria TaxID=28612 RepID=UPI000811233B|nr:PREDICTED: uncharacterized protein LOC108362001 [Rhagoletis zephyria]